MPDIDPIPLARLTTLRTGGVPERIIDAHSRDELVAALRGEWATGERWLALGGGSNLFVGDGEFDGTVVRILTTGIQRVPTAASGFVRLRIEAGHDWDALVAFAVAGGLAGIEGMSGIPGTVGAAPVQNVGAYGQEIEQTLVEVEILEESTGDVVVVPAADLGLGFRTSVFKAHYGSVAERPSVILSVTLELEHVGNAPRIVHDERLRMALGYAPGALATLGDVRERVLAMRRAKGMVLDASDPDTHSAGSFFQNAIVSPEFARTLPVECPRWPIRPDDVTETVIPLAEYDGVLPVRDTARAGSDVKISAGWLIEHAGLRKGFSLPRSRAALSTKHALALTNRGGASAAELAELARFVQRRVHAEFGLLLQPEPVLVDVEL
ncbi:MAG TPA: UDP-N-acetylenolpyruvoylglucosamine reductase [Microbacterium sp.]|nr:UDP-N-acetylenolpyruvoylglucosamine reductase [Microbacterium sp.]